jgi:hypothetical protein
MVNRKYGDCGGGFQERVQDRGYGMRKEILLIPDF